MKTKKLICALLLLGGSLVVPQLGNAQADGLEAKVDAYIKPLLE